VKRRTFITTPLMARAQQPTMPVVAMIHILSFENGHTIRS